MASERTRRQVASLGLLAAFLLHPAAAHSLELFEGNWGYEGTWLHVLDSTTMSDRVYWYELGDDVSYQVQFATDESFSAESVVLEESGILTNYFSPDLGPGSYVFRVREVHGSGVAGSWSETGTLDVVEDLKPPAVAILDPLPGQTFSAGDPISIRLEVSDDTLLRLARFTVDGEYAGTLGLKTENAKLSPSFDEARIVVFEFPLPSKGGKGLVEISVTVSDVLYRSTTRTVQIQKGKAAGESRGGAQKGRKN